MSRVIGRCLFGCDSAAARSACGRAVRSGPFAIFPIFGRRIAIAQSVRGRPRRRVHDRVAGRLAARRAPKGRRCWIRINVVARSICSRGLKRHRTGRAACAGASIGFRAGGTVKAAQRRVPTPTAWLAMTDRGRDRVLDYTRQMDPGQATRALARIRLGRAAQLGQLAWPQPASGEGRSGFFPL